jgi:hypothetical protein
MDGGWTGNSFPLAFLFHQYILEDTQNTFLFNTFLLDENMHVHTHKHNTHTQHICPQMSTWSICVHMHMRTPMHTHSHTTHNVSIRATHTPHTWTHACTNNIQHMCTHAYEHTHSHTTPHSWTHASTNNIQHNTPQAHAGTYNTHHKHTNSHTYDTQIAKVD